MGAAMVNRVAKSRPRPATGCRHASSSHHAVTKVTTTTPPVMCTEKTPTRASTAAGIRPRWDSDEAIRMNAGTASP